jgi:hypothetical protein
MTLRHQPPGAKPGSGAAKQPVTRKSENYPKKHFTISKVLCMDLMLIKIKNFCYCSSSGQRSLKPHRRVGRMVNGVVDRSKGISSPEILSDVEETRYCIIEDNSTSRGFVRGGGEKL